MRQPWGGAIIQLWKDVENRTWRCPDRMIGQRVLIHAGKARPTEQEIDRLHNIAALPGGWLTGLDYGGIIGSVEIVGCVTDSDSRWFGGPYGFVLANPKPLPFRPCRGMLGFFRPVYL